MIDVETLLQPFEGDEPSGPDLSGSNDFAEIERIHMDAFNPPQLTGVGVELDEPDWESVLMLGSGFIETQSKDLKVAAWMTNAALRTGGFIGFAEALELCLGLMEDHWEGLHPGVAARAAVLDWLCDDSSAELPAPAMYRVPLTQGGHDYFAYREWQRKQAAPAETTAGTEKYSRKDEPEEEEEAGFGESFLGTSREWYLQLVATLDRCGAAVTALDALSKERFPPAGETPPSFGRKIGASLKTVSKAAGELLALKPAPVSAQADEVVDGGESVVGGTGVPGVSVLQPRSAAEAYRAIEAGARYLRGESPHSPGPYLVLRALRWGELLASGPEIDPLVLDAPETAQRVKLKKLYLQSDWANLLEASEAAMATPAGRGWLDLQHYTISAAEQLGEHYGPVVEALYSALSGLLRDRPGLVSMSLMDDSYPASARTLQWLGEKGLLPAGQPGPREFFPRSGGGSPAPRKPQARPQAAPAPPAPQDDPPNDPALSAQEDPARPAFTEQGEPGEGGKVQSTRAADLRDRLKRKTNAAGGGDDQEVSGA